MRLHYVQHVPFEGLGSIAAWAHARGATVTRTQLYAGESVPPPEDFDWLLVMGGPMSVNDEDAYSWLAAEKAAVRAAIDADRTVVGICLGAQLIAAALGARVYANAVREIGWLPLSRAPEAATTPFAVLPAEMTVFQWHGETFDIPAGAVRLAASEVCTNQAFLWGQRVLALQFHLETTPAAAQALLDNCADELTDGPCVQTPTQILAPTPTFDALNACMTTLLDALAASPSRETG